MKEKLLNRLMALDFAAVDIQLYLDTHPGDDRSIEKYNRIIMEAAAAREEYERHFGPVCSFRNLWTKKNSWYENPWPWEFDFCFEMAREAQHVDL